MAKDLFILPKSSQMNTANDFYTSIEVPTWYFAITDDECSHPRGSCIPTSVIFVTLSNYAKQDSQRIVAVPIYKLSVTWTNAVFIRV